MHERTVCDLVIGSNWIGCQLDDGCVGVSCALSDGLTVKYDNTLLANTYRGKNAAYVASLIARGEDNILRAVGAAVLCAASQQQKDIRDDADKTRLFETDFRKNDIVGLIGHIAPVAKRLKEQVGRLIIFDEGISMRGDSDSVYPMDMQSALLPLCNKMVITGSSTINGSIDGLLDMCKNAVDIIIVGASTPMFSEGWKNTRVTRLAGSWWDNSKKDKIFEQIILTDGIAKVRPYRIPKIIKLPVV